MYVALYRNILSTSYWSNSGTVRSICYRSKCGRPRPAGVTCLYCVQDGRREWRHGDYGSVVASDTASSLKRARVGPIVAEWKTW